MVPLLGPAPGLGRRPSDRDYRRLVRTRSPRAIRATALGGVLGPAAFVSAWAILGARAGNYSATQDAISRLAATGAPTRSAMTTGFVVFALGVPISAIALREEVPGGAWILATATGLATLGVAAFPLGSPVSDRVHGAFATIGYATLAAIPLAAARPMNAQGRIGWARFSVISGVISSVSLLATVVGPWHGLFQRIGLSVADAWVIATSIDIFRRNQD